MSAPKEGIDKIKSNDIEVIFFIKILSRKKNENQPISGLILVVKRVF